MQGVGSLPEGRPERAVCTSEARKIRVPLARARGSHPLSGFCCCLFSGRCGVSPLDGVTEEMGRFFSPAHLWRQGKAFSSKAD